MGSIYAITPNETTFLKVVFVDLHSRVQVPLQLFKAHYPIPIVVYFSELLAKFFI